MNCHPLKMTPCPRRSKRAHARDERYIRARRLAGTVVVWPVREAF